MTNKGEAIGFRNAELSEQGLNYAQRLSAGESALDLGLNETRATVLLYVYARQLRDSKLEESALRVAKLAKSYSILADSRHPNN